MGISVSESNTVRQMQQHNKVKSRLKNQEIIRRELQYGVPQNAWDARNKQNIEETPPIPQPKPSIDKQIPSYINEQPRNIVFVRQKKIKEVQNDLSSSKNKSQHSAPTTPYKQKKEVIQFASKYLNWQKKSVDALEKQVPTTTSKHNVEIPPPQQPQPQKYSIHISQEKDEKQKISRKAKLHRESSISSPNFIQNSSKLAEFQKYDWQIPSDRDLLKPTSKIEVLPSMTLVLSNKFNENVGCMNECKDDEQFQKNRRQIMRDLLAGKREQPHQKLISCFDFNRQITSSKTCKFN